VPMQPYIKVFIDIFFWGGGGFFIFVVLKKYLSCPAGSPIPGIGVETDGGYVSRPSSQWQPLSFFSRKLELALAWTPS
jgi:hypothetical protein